jgi:hypothetical protein
MHLVNADDGKLITQLKIGDNINSTPAVLDGRIYVALSMASCIASNPIRPATGRSPSPAGRRVPEPECFCATSLSGTGVRP